jgi:serine/threonine protein kinase
VASALAYLHQQNVLHADLKAGNVLLSSDPASPTGLTAKVSDFGLSRALGVNQTHQSTRTVGTVTHVPPELLLQGKLSHKADVYAFGESDAEWFGWWGG